MDPIDTLRAEHRVIDLVLTAFAAWAHRIRMESNGTDQRAELGRFVHFFDRFGDRCHHAKEEDILFRALERADPRTRALVHVSFVEQEEQRRLLEPLQELACRTRPWTSVDRDAVTASVEAFIASMRAHLDAEEHVVFPAARACIPTDALDRTADAFASFENAENATGEHDRLRRLGESLVDTHAPRCAHVHRQLRLDSVTARES